MLKRCVLLLSLICLQTSVMAQYTITRAQLEQRKRHSRVNLHSEMEVKGEIRQLLYEPAYEYLAGFILEAENGKAYKIQTYYFVGETLYPFLKKNEKVTLRIKGDETLLTEMLYKSEEDKKAERKLGLKLSGLAHLKKISSSQGTFDLPDYDKADLAMKPSFDIVTDASIVGYTMGKRNSIRLILDNDDTINTYRTDLAKDYYLDGKVSYVRPLSSFPGAFYKSQHTYHMVDPYSSTKTLPLAKDLRIATVGRRSTFLDKAENLDFVTLKKTARGQVIVTEWTDGSEEKTQMTFSKKDEPIFNDFLERQGKKGLTMHYRKYRNSRFNFLYAIEKNGERVNLNAPNVPRPINEEDKPDPKETSTSTNPSANTGPQTTKGTLLKYLTTQVGLYAGFLLVNEALDTLTFRLWDTHGKKVLENFREGDKIELTYQFISTRDIIHERFDNRQVDMTTFYNPTNRSGMNLHSRYPWLALLEDDPNYDRKERRFKKTPYYAVKLKKGSLDLDITPNYANREKEYTPTEIALDVKILDIDKKRGDTRFYMENGDTLFMNVANGLKKGKRVSYTLMHPIVANGQAYDDPRYQDRVLQTVWVQKRKIGTLTPIYDDWMRLSGYESKIEGKKGLIRLAPDMAQEVNAYISRNRTKDLTLLCNQFDISKRMPTFYFFVGLTNPQGELVFDDHVREPQHYEVDTVFTSKVKEIVQHTDLYTYRNTTIILENNFVFSVNNDTFRSIEANALVGATMTLKGKPFIPREGEVLKEESYRLIKPGFLKAGNVEFKISE